MGAVGRRDGRGAAAGDELPAEAGDSRRRQTGGGGRCRLLLRFGQHGALQVCQERRADRLQRRAIGDIDVWNGEIYAGIETFVDGRGEHIQVAVYDADSLKWRRSIDWNADSGQVEVCGLAVDRDRGKVWMADWVDGRYLYEYDLASEAICARCICVRCRSGSRASSWRRGGCCCLRTTAMPIWTRPTTFM